MRAVLMAEFGGPEVLIEQETPDPVAGPGEAVIAVAFVNVCFVDTQRRIGGIWEATPTPPVIPGSGAGGVVVSVGSPEDSRMLGTQVVCLTGTSGAYAERVSVPVEAVFDVPPGLALDDAVALLTDGRTAMLYVALAEISDGDRVLVEAAAGGLGGLVVQRSKAVGATVVAAVGGERKMSQARAFGADVVVDYLRPKWSRELRSSFGEVDVVFDGIGGAIARSAFRLLASGGRFVSYGLAGGIKFAIPKAEARERGVSMFEGHPYTPEDLSAFTVLALNEAAAGRLQPLIGQRFPLDRAADAHRAIEARRTVGKTLLEIHGMA